MEKYLLASIAGVVAGTIGRYYMLRSDYRQYPSYPHGVVTHMSLGLIAAVLGAVAIPALAEREFTAVTFLALAATQFRDIREIERKTLTNIDRSELVARGPDYVEGIARVFESRNYLVILIAIISSGSAYYGGIEIALLTSIPAILASNRLMRGKQVGQIATVRSGEVRFEGVNLYVENIHFMNLGTERARRQVLERGLGVIIEPLDDNARETLANLGQRKAIAHEAASQLGVYRDVDTAEFMPIVRRNVDTGRIGLIILPIEKDIDCLIKAVKRVPVLESALSKPLQSAAGSGAAD
ncbi:MAG: YIEGIA family protein [Dethiobacteria bacterium]